MSRQALLSVVQSLTNADEVRDPLTKRCRKLRERREVRKRPDEKKHIGTAGWHRGPERGR
mgnify:CR=1 FL=1